MLKRVNIDELNKAISSGEKLLVFFSAEWCGQCKMSNLLIQKYIKQYPEINFIEIDVDDQNIWDHEKLNLKVVPTFVGFNNKQIVFNEPNYQMEYIFRKLLDKI